MKEVDDGHLDAALLTIAKAGPIKTTRRRPRPLTSTTTSRCVGDSAKPIFRGTHIQYEKTLLMSSPTLNPTSLRYKTFIRTNDDLPRPSDLARLDLGGHIPDRHSTMNLANDSSTDPKLKCCCGRADCAYLEHNNAAVGNIERKLERAAQLGQVRALLRLLACHSPSPARFQVST